MRSTRVSTPTTRRRHTSRLLPHDGAPIAADPANAHNSEGGGGGGVIRSSEVGRVSGRIGFDCHYAHYMRGCGLLRELELQKAACSFVQNALRILLHKLDHVTAEEHYPFAECVQMCALLCHPWDGVDMSMLAPADIFVFLHRLFRITFAQRLRHMRDADVTAAYRHARGIAALAHRCLVIPNALLQVSFEGIHIVDGEAQGVHVEDINVVCSARNHWKPFVPHVCPPPASRDDGYHPYSGGNPHHHYDAYAHYGLPCVVTALPDVYYFEVTIEISFTDHPVFAVGLSSVPLVPLETVHAASAIFFSSDGMLSGPQRASTEFSEPWVVGDVIGCGMFAPRNSVFFTRNGELLGVAMESRFATHIPFVEARGHGTVMKFIVNFGVELPFVFDMATLHGSCRFDYLSSATVCDAALITAKYLITVCYRNLAAAAAAEEEEAEAADALDDIHEDDDDDTDDDDDDDDTDEGEHEDATFRRAHVNPNSIGSSSSSSTAAVHRDAVCGLLEHATHFLCHTARELLACYHRHAAEAASQTSSSYYRTSNSSSSCPAPSESTSADHTSYTTHNHPIHDGNRAVHNRNTSSASATHHQILHTLVVTLSHLFHCLHTVIACFGFDAVTRTTVTAVLQLCTTVLTDARDRWLRVRAAQSLSRLVDRLPAARWAELTAEERSLVCPAESVVQTLMDLARVRLVRDSAPRRRRRVGSVTPPPYAAKVSSTAHSPCPHAGCTPLGFVYADDSNRDTASALRSAGVTMWACVTDSRRCLT